MLRTTQNKIYRQGIANANTSSKTVFPTKPEELFAYDGLIIGSVEASYFTPAQQQMIRDFADRRGAACCSPAGRYSLGDGGYANTPMAEMMPLRLPTRKTWSPQLRRCYPDGRRAARASSAAWSKAAESNVERWKKMPQIANYAAMGSPKPGAVVLMNVAEQGTGPRRCSRSKIMVMAGPPFSPPQEPGAGRCCRTTRIQPTPPSGSS